MQETKEIHLTGGGVAIVDSEDYDKVCHYRWNTLRRKNGLYAQTRAYIDGIKRTLHLGRFIMGLSFGDRREVDHMNHNGLDNRKCNLRICSHEDNAINCLSSRGQSHFKGVYPHSNGRGWVAQIGYRGKCIYLGYYTNEELAALAYDFAAMKYHREFANFNF